MLDLQVEWWDEIVKQDGRLAPAYFSPNYKYFDQLLQTVTNKTTVLILVFKEFLQTSIWPLISVLYAKGYHDFPSKLFCLTLPKNFVGEPFGVSENFWYRKILCFRGLCHDFLSNFFLSHSTEKFRWGTHRCIRKFRVAKNFMHQRGGRGYQDFLSNFFLSHSAENIRRWTLLCCVSENFR